MTAVEVCYRYGRPPAERELRSIATFREVYGVRTLVFDGPAKTVRVEYDATRLNEPTISRLLRQAGLDIEEKLALA